MRRCSKGRFLELHASTSTLSDPSTDSLPSSCSGLSARSGLQSNSSLSSPRLSSHTLRDR